MAEGTTLPDAVRMLTRKSYQDGVRDAERDAYPYAVSLLLYTLRDELPRHPYLAPGLHTAINVLAALAKLSRDEWRDYLDEDEYELMHTMPWDHPGEVRWIPPLDTETEAGSD